jgi:hypothetical protein
LICFLEDGLVDEKKKKWVKGRVFILFYFHFFHKLTKSISSCGYPQNRQVFLHCEHPVKQWTAYFQTFFPLPKKTLFSILFVQGGARKKGTN